jgi:hypothetical protein
VLSLILDVLSLLLIFGFLARQDVMSVRPLRGTLAGGESIPVEWSFVPHHEKHYLTKVKCVYTSAVSGTTNFLTAACLDQPEEFERLIVTAIGDGTAGVSASCPPPAPLMPPS